MLRWLHKVRQEQPVGSVPPVPAHHPASGHVRLFGPDERHSPARPEQDSGQAGSERYQPASGDPAETSPDLLAAPTGGQVADRGSDSAESSPAEETEAGDTAKTEDTVEDHVYRDPAPTMMDLAVVQAPAAAEESSVAEETVTEEEAPAATEEEAPGEAPPAVEARAPDEPVMYDPAPTVMDRALSDQVPAAAEDVAPAGTDGTDETVYRDPAPTRMDLAAFQAPAATEDETPAETPPSIPDLAPGELILPDPAPTVMDLALSDQVFQDPSPTVMDKAVSEPVFREPNPTVMDKVLSRTRSAGTGKAPGKPNVYRDQAPTIDFGPIKPIGTLGSVYAVLAMAALFGFSLLMVAVGYATGLPALRLIGVLGAMVFGVGAAPLQLSQQIRLHLRLAVAAMTGISVTTLIASVMALVPAWHPLPAAIAVGSVAVLLHIYGCWRALTTWPGLIGQFSWWVHLRPASINPSLIFSVGGTALWVVSAVAAGHVVPTGPYGFLTHISVSWIAGLLLLVVSIGLARGKPEFYAMFGLVSLLAALTVTPAMVYGTPRIQSAQKHIDLIQQLMQTHHLNRLGDIYQAYSGFFSNMAWVCDLARVHDPTGLAAYWPFVIGLVSLAELRLFFGRFTTSPYQMWAATTFVVLVNAVGQDYFSPQSVGFVLALGVFGLAAGRTWPGLPERARILVLLLTGCALAVTHELSPFIAGGTLCVLVVFRLTGPWWVPATNIVPAAAWAVLSKPVLAGSLSLSQLGKLSNFEPPQTLSTPGLQRLPVVDDSSHALLLGLLVLIVLAVIGFFRTIKSRTAWAYMLCVGVGLMLVAATAYGNEGIFRAALFGIPWLTVMALRAVPRRRGQWLSVAFGLTTAALTATYVVAQFGLDNAGVIQPSDVRALQVYQADAPLTSYMLTLSYGDTPYSIEFPYSGDYLTWPAFVSKAEVVKRAPALKASDAIELARQYVTYVENNQSNDKQLYALWSPASTAYSVDYGLETRAQADKWRQLLISSPAWHVVYHSRGTYLFHLVPTAIPKAKTAG
jgi:hypothetical protein